MSPDQNNQNPYGQQPQTNNSGQYAVVPAKPAVVNDGHSGHNPYEFILNNNAPKRSFWLNGSFAIRIVLLVGGAAALITVGILVLAALTPPGSTPGIKSMAARQQEILRIIDLSSKNVTGQDTRNLVANVQASILSDKRSTAAYLATHNVKIDSQTLARYKNDATDRLLETASGTNSYDSTVSKALTSQLQAYQELISNTYKQASGKQAKQLLLTSYVNAAKLAQQAKALPSGS